MNPQQPDYGFILQNNSNAPKIQAPKSQKQRIIMVAFVAISVMLVGLIIMIAINLFSTDNSEKLVDLAIEQNEIQRIMDIGVKDAKTNNVKILAQTASSTLATHKQSTISIATKRNIKITDKQLATGKTSNIDKQLETAKNSNNFDEVFLGIYNSRLSSYSKKIKDLYDAEDDKTFKSNLNTYYKNSVIMASDYKPATEN